MPSPNTKKSNAVKRRQVSRRIKGLNKAQHRFEAREQKRQDATRYVFVREEPQKPSPQVSRQAKNMSRLYGALAALNFCLASMSGGRASALSGWLALFAAYQIRTAAAFSPAQRIFTGNVTNDFMPKRAIEHNGQLFATGAVNASSGQGVIAGFDEDGGWLTKVCGLDGEECEVLDYKPASGGLWCGTKGSGASKRVVCGTVRATDGVVPRPPEALDPHASANVTSSSMESKMNTFGVSGDFVFSVTLRKASGDIRPGVVAGNGGITTSLHMFETGADCTAGPMLRLPNGNFVMIAYSGGLDVYWILLNPALDTVLAQKNVAEWSGNPPVVYNDIIYDPTMDRVIAVGEISGTASGAVHSGLVSTIPSDFSTGPTRFQFRPGAADTLLFKTATLDGAQPAKVFVEAVRTAGDNRTLETIEIDFIANGVAGTQAVTPPVVGGPGAQLTPVGRVNVAGASVRVAHDSQDPAQPRMVVDSSTGPLDVIAGCTSASAPTPVALGGSWMNNGNATFPVTSYGGFGTTVTEPPAQQSAIEGQAVCSPPPPTTATTAIAAATAASTAAAASTLASAPTPPEVVGSDGADDPTFLIAVAAVAAVCCVAIIGGIGAYLYRKRQKPADPVTRPTTLPADLSAPRRVRREKPHFYLDTLDTVHRYFHIFTQFTESDQAARDSLERQTGIHKALKTKRDEAGFFGSTKFAFVGPESIAEFDSVDDFLSVRNGGWGVYKKLKVDQKSFDKHVAKRVARGMDEATARQEVMGLMWARVKAMAEHEVHMHQRLAGKPGITQMIAYVEVDNDGNPEFYILQEPAVMNLEEFAAKMPHFLASQPQAHQEPLRQAFYINALKGLAQGLLSMYEEDIAHLDVHPGNMLFFIDPETGHYCKTKLTDFGLSRELPPGQTVRQNQKGDKCFMAWAPPERYTGQYDAMKADVYSLGLSMMQILLGHFPLFVEGDARFGFPQGSVHLATAAGFWAAFSTQMKTAASRQDCIITPLAANFAVLRQKFQGGPWDDLINLLEEMTRIDEANRPTADQVSLRLNVMVGDELVSGEQGAALFPQLRGANTSIDSLDDAVRTAITDTRDDYQGGCYNVDKNPMPTADPDYQAVGDDDDDLDDGPGVAHAAGSASAARYARTPADVSQQSFQPSYERSPSHLGVDPAAGVGFYQTPDNQEADDVDSGFYETQDGQGVPGAPASGQASHSHGAMFSHGASAAGTPPPGGAAAPGAQMPPGYQAV
jgi:serine/threonine protein kinase